MGARYSRFEERPPPPRPTPTLGVLPSRPSREPTNRSGPTTRLQRSHSQHFDAYSTCGALRCPTRTSMGRLEAPLRRPAKRTEAAAPVRWARWAREWPQRQLPMRETPPRPRQAAARGRSPSRLRSGGAVRSSCLRHQMEAVQGTRRPRPGVCRTTTIKLRAPSLNQSTVDDDALEAPRRASSANAQARRARVAATHAKRPSPYFSSLAGPMP